MGSLPPPSLLECLTALPGHASDALRNLRAPPPPSLCPSLSLWISSRHPLSRFAPRSCPRYHPLSSSLSVFGSLFPPSHSLTAATTAARSLGLSEARPLVFLLFPSRLRLLLVITTNLSRINSPSGINSSTVQAEKEKVIAGVGTGNSPSAPPLCRPYSSCMPRIRLAALCAPCGERERRYRGRMPGVMLHE